MILKMLTVGPLMSNCYIVGSEKTSEGMIIDPGADADVILSNVKDLGLDIKIIVVTHDHFDHIDAIKEVKEATGAPFALHETHADRPAMEKLTQSISRMTGLPMRDIPNPDRLLKDGDIVSVGEADFKVLHVPGHSPDGIALYSDGVVFVGDILFQYSIGRTDFPGGSYEQLMEGIFDKLLILPDSTVVYPGHGPKTTIGAERKMNHFIIDWAERRSQR